MESPKELRSGKPALPTNIRPGWKPLEVTNILAYYIPVSITAVNSFKVQANGAGGGI